MKTEEYRARLQALDLNQLREESIARQRDVIDLRHRLMSHGRTTSPDFEAADRRLCCCWAELSSRQQAGTEPTLGTSTRLYDFWEGIVAEARQKPSAPVQASVSAEEEDLPRW